jgi:hypothetical protein
MRSPAAGAPGWFTNVAAVAFDGELSDELELALGVIAGTMAEVDGLLIYSMISFQHVSFLFAVHLLPTMISFSCARLHATFTGRRSVRNLPTC